MKVKLLKNYSGADEKQPIQQLLICLIIKLKSIDKKCCSIILIVIATFHERDITGNKNTSEKRHLNIKNVFTQNKKNKINKTPQLRE